MKNCLIYFPWGDYSKNNYEERTRVRRQMSRFLGGLCSDCGNFGIVCNIILCRAFSHRLVSKVLSRRDANVSFPDVLKQATDDDDRQSECMWWSVCLSSPWTLPLECHLLGDLQSGVRCSMLWNGWRRQPRLWEVAATNQASLALSKFRSYLCNAGTNRLQIFGHRIACWTMVYSEFGVQE